MKLLSSLVLTLTANLLSLAPGCAVAAEASSSPPVVATRSGMLEGRMEKGLEVFRGSFRRPASAASPAVSVSDALPLRCS